MLILLCEPIRNSDLVLTINQIIPLHYIFDRNLFPEAIFPFV